MNALELVRRQLLRQQALKEAQKTSTQLPFATAATATSSRLLPDALQHLINQIRFTVTRVQMIGAHTAGVVALVAHNLRLRPICQ